MELLKSYIVEEPHSVKIYTDRNLKQEIRDEFPNTEYKYNFFQITSLLIEYDYLYKNSHLTSID